MQRPQKTSYEDCSQEIRLEAGGNEKVQSISTATGNRRDGENAYTNNLLEEILEKDNLNIAYKRVVENKGKHGIDGMSVDELLPYLRENGSQLRSDLLEGNYKPKSVRRVEIPKPDGGVRQLGIPTVIDRMIQQAIAQKLQQIYEPKFSEGSYGFRPCRNAQQAVRRARTYMNEGYTWVVDVDLEKYFDTVNHDKLMAILAREVKDKRVLKLIRAYLNSGVMINGVKVKTDKGCPQGGPLSPLLSNIMLDELDKELEKRGHKFCRYADDCQLYVKSKRAAERVMENITEFIENKLKLKVNKTKSAIDRPWKRKFLGFSFYTKKDEVKIRVHPKSIKRLKEKIKVITSRSNAMGIGEKFFKLRQLITGWVAYFSIANMKNLLKRIDKWTRRRIRMCFWKEWKKVGTKYKNLKKLGVDKYKAWEYANTRKGYWRISNSPILAKTLTNQKLKTLGYLSLTERYAQVTNS